MASSSGSSSSSFHEPFEKAYDALLELASKNARKHSSLIESLHARTERLKNVPDDDLHDDNDTFYEKRTEDLEYFLEPIEIAFKSKHASMEERAVICLTSLIGGRMITGRCFEEEEDKEDKEKDNEKFTIPERDSKLRERFNAKLVAKATTIQTTSTLNIRGRGHAFKKQREEEDEINDEKLDEIEPRDKKLTPLEAQVRDFKRKYPSVLLLFEVGYKFHFYGKDARKAAETLNVFAYPGKTWLQASGPVHRLAVYVRRLVNAGHKVGVVRQTETAALKAEGSTKGSVFTRELVALYTKATMDAGVSIAAEPAHTNNESDEAQKAVDIIENKTDREGEGDEDLQGVVITNNHRKSSTTTSNITADEQKHRLSNYLLCISEEKKSERGNKDEIALVAIETSVGNIYYSHFEDDSSRSRLESALLKISPCEILFAGGGEGEEDQGSRRGRGCGAGMWR